MSFQSYDENRYLLELDIRDYILRNHKHEFNEIKDILERLFPTEDSFEIYNMTFKSFKQLYSHLFEMDILLYLVE